MLDDLSQDNWAARPYAEILRIAERDGSILVVPVGSLEQHGEHLPTGTDTFLATAAARRGVESVSDDVPVLLTPPIWSGYSPHHFPFGGTVSLEHDTFLDTVTAVVDSAARNGFDAVALVNGHGGNKSLLSTAISVAGRSNPEVDVSQFLYLDLLGPHLDDLRRSDVPGVHGGELETSLMLAVRPELVDVDAATSTPQSEPYERTGSDLLDGGPVSVYRSFDEYTETGTVGDPGAASRATGERAFDLLEAEIAAILRSIHANAGADGA